MSLIVKNPSSVERSAEILTEDALAFVEKLHERFAARRDELVGARRARRDWKSVV